MLAGLITYLLLIIYCHEQHSEPVNIHRVRQLRNQILNESRMEHSPSMTLQGKECWKQYMQVLNLTSLICGMKCAYINCAGSIALHVSFGINIKLLAERYDRL